MQTFPKGMSVNKRKNRFICLIFLREEKQLKIVILNK